MNYSKTIREYCLKNPGMVFDMSYEREQHFSMVPYKTFCKILSRSEAEGIIKCYKDLYARMVHKRHRYSLSTIFTLDQILTGLGIKNNLNDIAKECYYDE